MTKQERESYRQDLLALATRLQGDIRGLAEEALRMTGGEAGGSLSNAPLHLADLATDNVEQQVAADLLQNDQSTLIAIRNALDRLEKGTYGQCEECGKRILTGRLKAIPHASTCVDCARKVEAQSENGNSD